MEPTEPTTPQQIELAVVRGHTSGVFVLTDTGIQIAEDTSFDQWKEGLKTIRWFKTRLAIGLADYITWGNKKFGQEKVEGALEQLEFDASLVKSALTINGIPNDIRFANLTADHYIEIAKANLPKPKQVKWARVASEQHLTPTQLRFSMRENEVVDQHAAKALASGVITVHGIRQEFDVWLNRVGGLEGILKMDQEHQEEIMGEIEAIVQFGQELRAHLEPELKEA